MSDTAPSTNPTLPDQHVAPGAPVPAADSTVQPSSTVKSPIVLRSPLKYRDSNSSPSNFTTPPLEWLQATWYVTHSTLPMWRKAKNVRITYKIISPSSPSGPVLLDDEVCSEPTQRTLLPQPKSIKGVDTPDGDGTWNWRGRGWLKVASSHWEVLGWGERDIGGEKEMWVVTWFAPSMFTPAGVDLYSSRREGLSEETFRDIMAGLESLETKELADLVKTHMKGIEMEY